MKAQITFEVEIKGSPALPAPTDKEIADYVLNKIGIGPMKNSNPLYWASFNPEDATVRFDGRQIHPRPPVNNSLS